MAGPGQADQDLFELKNARRILVEFNVFENNWAQAQVGYAILFTPRNQDGGCPWCVGEDVTFQFNIVRNVAGVFNIAGYDWPHVSAQTRHITIRHNLVHDVSRTLGGAGWFLILGDEPRDIVVVDHNTIDHDGTAVVYAHGGSATSPEQILGFRFTNNAQRHNAYGINGADASYGNGAITMYFPDAVVAGNWLPGGAPSRYPGGNLFAGDFGTAFANATVDDYLLAPQCLLRGAATDGSDIGADVATLLNGIRGVVEGHSGRPSAPTNLRIIGR